MTSARTKGLNRRNASADRARSHGLEQNASLQDLTLMDHRAERIVDEIVIVFVDMDVNPALLRAFGCPQHGGRRRPHLERQTVVVVQIDSGGDILVVIGLSPRQVGVGS